MAETTRLNGLVGNVAIKAPCAVATTANITLNGEQTIDGVTTSGSRVLVKNQASAVNNGIYVSDTGAWERAQDFDGSLDVTEGTLVKVNGGTVGSGFWYVSTLGNPIPGTDAIAFGKASTVLAVISPFVQTLLDDVDAATFRASIGAGTGNGDMTIAQQQAQTNVAFTTTGTAPTFLVDTVPDYGALAPNQRMRINWHQSSNAPTLTRDGLAVKNVKQYDATGSKIPATVVAGMLSDVEYDGVDYVVFDTLSPPQIQGLPTPTFNAGAMTIPSAAFNLDFRSSTLTSGAVTRLIGTAAALVVPSGASLGTVNAVQSDIVILELNVAGVLETAVINLAGGTDLSETGVISTTAISAGSTSASIAYSTTARSNVPYRVVGFYRSTQTTAGTWAAAPTLIQGSGGEAFVALASLGNGQTWQDVTASRNFGTTYYNTTGKTITVSATNSSATQSVPNVGGVSLPANGASGTSYGALVFQVPPGMPYSIANGTKVTWCELR